LERPAVSRAFITNSFRSLPARVLDLSLEGVGLLVNEPLSVGTRLSIELDSVAGAPFEMVAEVANVTGLPDGSWRCGCELVWKITAAELQALLK
jgi:hypothetical protein